MREIFHITSRSAWAEALETSHYEGDTLKTEGFIHCSDASQVLRVANARFRERRDLVLLEIDPRKLAAELRYEDGGEGELFPHVYGPLNCNAVTEVRDFLPDETGEFRVFPF